MKWARRKPWQEREKLVACLLGGQGLGGSCAECRPREGEQRAMTKQAVGLVECLPSKHKSLGFLSEYHIILTLG